MNHWQGPSYLAAAALLWVFFAARAVAGQTTVLVWYDPAHPKRSVLEPGVHAWAMFSLASALTLAAVAAWWAWSLRQVDDVSAFG